MNGGTVALRLCCEYDLILDQQIFVRKNYVALSYFENSTSYLIDLNSVLLRIQILTMHALERLIKLLSYCCLATNESQITFDRLG